MLKSDVKGDVSGSHEDGGEGRTRCQSARATRARKGGQGIEHASKGFHSQQLFFFFFKEFIFRLQLIEKRRSCCINRHI